MAVNDEKLNFLLFFTEVSLYLLPLLTHRNQGNPRHTRTILEKLVHLNLIVRSTEFPVANLNWNALLSRIWTHLNSLTSNPRWLLVTSREGFRIHHSLDALENLKSSLTHVLSNFYPWKKCVMHYYHPYC